MKIRQLEKCIEEITDRVWNPKKYDSMRSM